MIIASAGILDILNIDHPRDSFRVGVIIIYSLLFVYLFSYPISVFLYVAIRGGRVASEQYSNYQLTKVTDYLLIYYVIRILRITIITAIILPFLIITPFKLGIINEFENYETDSYTINLSPPSLVGITYINLLVLFLVTSFVLIVVHVLTMEHVPQYLKFISILLPPVGLVFAYRSKRPIVETERIKSVLTSWDKFAKYLSFILVITLLSFILSGGDFWTLLPGENSYVIWKLVTLYLDFANEFFREGSYLVYTIFYLIYYLLVFLAIVSSIVIPMHSIAHFLKMAYTYPEVLIVDKSQILLAVELYSLAQKNQTVSTKVNPSSELIKYLDLVQSQVVPTED